MLANAHLKAGCCSCVGPHCSLTICIHILGGFNIDFLYSFFSQCPPDQLIWDCHWLNIEAGFFYGRMPFLTPTLLVFPGFGSTRLVNTKLIARWRNLCGTLPIHASRNWYSFPSRRRHCMVSSHYPNVDWSCDDLGDAISLFKQKMNMYLEDEKN